MLGRPIAASPTRSMLPLIVILLVMTVGAGVASPLDALKNEGGTDNLYMDFAVPDLAAFTMLGINQNQVARPTNVKEFASGLINFVDSDGAMNTGLAVEWAPFATLGTSTLEAYRKNSLIRRLQLSVASTSIEGGSKLAAGLRWVPIDRSDPLLDEGLQRFVQNQLDELGRFAGDATQRVEFNGRLMGVLVGPDVGMPPARAVELAGYLDLVPAPKIAPPSPLSVEAATSRFTTEFDERADAPLAALPPAVRTTLEELVAEYVAIRIAQEVKLIQFKTWLTTNLQKEKERFKKKAWNNFVLQFAVGQTWNSTDNSWQGLRSDTLVGFAGFALPVTDHGQFVVHAQYDGGYKTVEGVDSDFSVGGRAIVGSSGFQFTAEYAYWWTEAETEELGRNRSRVTTGLQFQVQTDLWLELGIGGEFIEGEGSFSDMLTLANVKYALGKKPRWDIQ